MRNQFYYHKQYEIDLSSNPLNCANKLHAGQKVIIIMCHQTGAISVFRRYSDDKLSVDSNNPLIEVKGEVLPNPSLSGLQIGLIEHHEPSNNISQNYIFI